MKTPKGPAVVSALLALWFLSRVADMGRTLTVPVDPSHLILLAVALFWAIASTVFTVRALQPEGGTRRG